MIYKVKSFLELHEQLLEKGLYTGPKKCGLCNIEFTRDNKEIRLGKVLFQYGLTPMSSQMIEEMEKQGIDTSELESDYYQLFLDGVDSVYWGSESLDPCCGIYTPLRQNLVLLLAALNNGL